MQTEQKAFPLNTLGMGEHAYVYTLPSGRAISNRLVSLGFTPGVELDMVQNFGHGPLIVALRGTRVALGRGEDRKSWCGGKRHERVSRSARGGERKAARRIGKKPP